MNGETLGKILDYLEKNRPWLSFIKEMGDWILLYDTRRKEDVLYNWNGEELWGPWTCVERAPTQFGK